MEYTTLGRTGLRVSVAGLGCGGNAKAGLGRGKSEAEAVALIRRAMDLGVNFLDTARSYGTEKVVGQAIAAVPRESVVVSLKNVAGSGVTGETLIAAIDASLREIGTDYLDIFHLHGVYPQQYDHALEELVPAMLRAREAGKIRFLGITETSPNDHAQTMLNRAAGDGCWDVMMLGFNMMHQVARTGLLPQTMERNIGTLIMFAVRNLFSVPGRLQETMRALAADGRVPGRLADSDDLEENIAAILKPPLPAADTARLADLFGHLQGTGLDLPGPA